MFREDLGTDYPPCATKKNETVKGREKDLWGQRKVWFHFRWPEAVPLRRCLSEVRGEPCGFLGKGPQMEQQVQGPDGWE